MDLTKKQNSKGQFINGHWQNPQGSSFSSVNPARGNTLWEGFSANKEAIQSAFDAAQKASKTWALSDFNTRCNLVLAFAKKVEERKDNLALLIALETGKPLWEAKTEVGAVIGKVNLSITAYKERTGGKQSEQNGLVSSLRFKPYGVVAVLGAFNFPAHLSNGHIVPALLAGNTVIYKPSELTPAVAEFMMECWQDSGLPEGVINCVQGGIDCGKALLEQPLQGVYFTGSYQTGLKIHQSFASRPEVILALEMGGNNPLVIGHVKQMKAAVYHALLSGFITAGQRCTCARRLMIPKTPMGDEFLANFIKASQQLLVGDFEQNPEPFMGPVIRYEHALQHLVAQDERLKLGGEALLKMTLLKEKTGLLSPGIIDMSAVKNAPDEEIFAPLVQVYRYSDFDEAIKMANQTRYGLAAGLLSDEQQEYDRFFSSVNAGLINWNRPTTGAASNLPFGGIGFSGNHRPSAYFAADYCAYPIASQEDTRLSLPESCLPGVEV